MITEFNFNKVFSEAWLKSVVPVNIVAGFRKCGVDPYNPAAISVPGRGSSTKGGESADECGASFDNEDGRVSPGDQGMEYRPVVKLVEHRLMKEIADQLVMGLRSGMEIRRME